LDDTNIDYENTWIRLLHDDIIDSGKPKDLQHMHIILVKALNKCGLDLQSKKTKVLHHKEMIQNNNNNNDTASDFDKLISDLEVTDDHVNM
jgi:hypothetical protein